MTTEHRSSGSSWSIIPGLVVWISLCSAALAQDPPPELAADGGDRAPMSPPAELPLAPSPDSADALATPDPAALSEGLLELCRSFDEAARRFCLGQLIDAPRLPPEVRPLLAFMAASDPLLSWEAAQLHRQLYAEDPPRVRSTSRTRPPASPAGVIPPPPREETAEEDVPRPYHGDATRVIYMPTAFLVPPGDARINAFQLGTFNVDFGVSEHLQAGLQTMLPIGLIALGGSTRFATEFDGGAFGVQANALALIPFTDGGDPAILAGAISPLATFGDRDNYLNAGLVLAYAGDSEGGGGGGVVVPHLGGSYRVSERVRLGLEIMAPTIVDESELGELLVVLWGVRIMGSSIWGDIALIDPICEGCGELYETLLLGIPFLNFGAEL